MTSNKHPISLVIADDHQLLRDGLAFILSKEAGLKITGIARNGAELVQLVGQHKPDVVLTDIVMPLLNGIEATRQIKNLSPATEVIALSMFDEQSVIVEMLEAGAIGYLLKNADRSEILDAIHSVSDHEHYYCKEISVKLAKYVLLSNSRHQPVITFTKKELEVIRYICKELTTQQIGKKLYLSKRTIDGYRSSILNKMNVKGTAGIVMYAMQHNLLEQKDVNQV